MLLLLHFGIFIVLLQQTTGNILAVIEKEAAPTMEEQLKTLLGELFHDDNKLITFRMSRVHEEDIKKVCLLSDVSGVIDLTWSGWTRLQELCLHSDLPYMLLESPLRGVARAVDNVLSGLRDAKDAVIVLEDGQLMEEFLYHLSGVSPLRVYLSVGLDPPAAQTLLAMRPSPSFYVLLGSTTAVNSMFNSAVNSQLVKDSQRWFAFFTDFTYKEFTGSKSDVIGIYPISGLCCVIMGERPSCECHKAADFTKEETTLKQVGQLLADVWKGLPTSQSSTTTLRCGSRRKRAANNETRNQFYQLLKQNLLSYPLLGLSSDPLVTLYPRLSLDINSTLSGHRIASWTSDQGLTLNQSRERVSVKRFFRVGVAEAIPWSYRVISPEGAAPRDQEGVAWAGYCLDFLKRLALDLRFDFELVSSGEFGARGKDDRWTGLVGDLARGNTDLVVAPLTMTSEREEIIDFVAPYYEQTGITIVIRKPERSSSLFKFMTVLRLEVWLSIVAALVVTGVMIWFLEKYSPYSARNNKQLHPYPCREFTLKESFWFALTSFTPQGGGEAPKALSGRTLVAAYWLFVVLMLATFTANLAAFLTVERMQAPVQSLEQLSRQSRINYTVVKDSDTHSYFRNMKSAEDTLYRMWKEVALNASSDQTQYRVWDYPIKEQYGTILKAIERTGPVPDAATGFQKVNENEAGWFALIHDAAEIKYELYRNCNLTEVGEVFAEQPYAVAVQQGSQLNEELSREILDLQKERYFETLSAKYWNNSEGSACFSPADNEGITLESLGGVFIATLFGLALAMVTLAVEIFFHRRHQNAKVQNLAPDQFYPEYVSKREFSTEHLLRKPSKLIRPAGRVLTVLPRSHLY